MAFPQIAMIESTPDDVFDEELNHTVEALAAWLQVLRGSVNALGHDLAAGDGVAITAQSAVSAQAAVPSEVLLFDLA